MSWGLKMTIIAINTVYRKSTVSGQQNKLTHLHYHADWVGQGHVTRHNIGSDFLQLIMSQFHLLFRTGRVRLLWQVYNHISDTSSDCH